MFIPSKLGATAVSYYIDLGTSSYVIQIALAVGLGALATMGIYWRRILSWFREIKNGKRNKKS